MGGEEVGRGGGIWYYECSDDIAYLLFCLFVCFFFNDTATTEIYTLSLHDALPISGSKVIDPRLDALKNINGTFVHPLRSNSPAINAGIKGGAPLLDQRRSKRDGRVDIGAFEAIGSAASSDRKSTRLNSSHPSRSRMPSSA